MKPLFIVLGLLSLLVTTSATAHPGADAALNYFNGEIGKFPANQTLYIQRGVTYSNDGQYPRALDDFTRATRLGEPVLVSFDLGVLHYRMGEFDKALRYFDEFLLRFPNHTSGLEYRARLHHDAGDHKASVADFRRLFELVRRPNPGHYISVAQMLQSAGGNGVESALAILDQGNTQLGLTPQLQHYAIELERGRGKPENAIERLKALQPMLGESPDWKLDMAELRLQAGQTEQAIALLDKVSIQLATLRKTPARLELGKRLDRVRAEISGTQS